jgi:hypothetical protein
MINQDCEMESHTNLLIQADVNFLIIVTAGRTGSTILQHLLNQDPETLIRGENNNFFYYFYRAYHAIEDPNAAKFRIESGSKHPWYGFENFKSEELKKQTRSLAIKFLLGTNSLSDYQRIGFKEIRFFPLIRYKPNSNEPNTSELTNYLLFLSNALGNVKFIHLTRDSSEVVKSGWWGINGDQQENIERIDFFNQTISRAKASLDIVPFGYELLKSKNIARIQEILLELGINLTRKKITETLSIELAH